VGAVQLRPGRVEPWRPARVAIDPWTVLRLARYRRREDAPAPVWEATRAMVTRAEELTVPDARLRVVRVKAVEPARASLTEGPSFTGHAIARHLAGARRAVAFMLTLGPALEAEVVALGERQESLEAYLLDLAGWAGIEAAVRALRQDLVAALPGAAVSHRLGPGHRDWPLTEQRDLMSLFEGEAAPVRLSEHGVLVPFKSISGLFALRFGSDADPATPSREGASGRSASARRGPARA
jgi:hypothetical protein